MVAAYGLRRLNVLSYWPYVIIGGTMCWVGLHLAHLHPALALVFIIPFLPHRCRRAKPLFEEDLSDHSPLARFEHEWKVVVDFGLFMFGLANAGVEFSSVGPVSWLVLIALIAGKTLGVYSFGCLSEMIGFSLPRGMGRRDLLVAGVIAGTGFTVALFVAGEAFSDPVIRGAAKMGAMLSVLAAVAGMLLGRLLGVKKR
jgi:NhaA family Na+:H+ antiporter